MIPRVSGGSILDTHEFRLNWLGDIEYLKASITNKKGLKG
jgi:hypothetical protein